MIDQFIEKINEAIDRLKEWPGKEIELFHHNDTDGLSSGTILETAFSRYGFKVKRFALEKPYPLLLEKVLSSQGKTIVFTDFAARSAPFISELNRGKNLVIILDHHTAEPVEDNLVYNLDGDLFNIKGDIDISASATCYLFARELNNRNRDLAHLAVLGAVGDGFFKDGRLTGINGEVVSEAEDQNIMRVIQERDGEKYFMTINGHEYACEELAGSLDILGAAGYYQGGADMGVEICKTGFSKKAMAQIELLKKMKDKIFKSEIERLKSNGLNSSEFIEWFDVENRFSPMGVKMIGVFCNELRNSDIVNRDKYLAGFQTIPDTIPGFGKIGFTDTKISMRVSDTITSKIRSGEMPALTDFLPEATLNLNGFVDACHGLSAATTVSIGKEKILIEEMNIILKNRIK